jgi:D-alanyl-D-alanine carboxypeptidase
VLVHKSTFIQTSMNMRFVTFQKIEATLTSFLCRRPDSNRHVLRHTPLKRACLPISPLRHFNSKVKYLYFCYMLRNPLFSALFLFALSIQFLASQEQIQWTGILTDTTHLNRTIGRTYKTYPVPAIGAGLFRSDTLLAVRLEGLHKWPNGNLVNEQNYFHLGGNSMAITSFIAARLVESGKISWETTFFDLFPSLQKRSHPAYPNFTLADLLSHRAQVAELAKPSEFQNIPSFKGNPLHKRAKFALWILAKPPLDSGIHYSNGGYALAALMLEYVSGKTYMQLVEHYIVKSLGLRCSSGWPNRISPAQPWGHWKTDPKSTFFSPVPPSTTYQIPEILAPAGDLCMPLYDYTLFLKHQLRGLQGKNADMSKKTYEFMHFCRPTFALGWLNRKDPSTRISTHDGSAGNFYCHATLFPDIDLGIIVVTNAEGKAATDAVGFVRESLLNKIFQFDIPELPKPTFPGEHPFFEVHEKYHPHH